MRRNSLIKWSKLRFVRFSKLFSRFIWFKNSSHRKSYKIFDKYAVEKWSWKSSAEVRKYWSKLQSFIEILMHFQTKLMLCNSFLTFQRIIFSIRNISNYAFQLHMKSVRHTLYLRGNRCSARVTSARNINFGTKFDWNVKFGTMEK